MCLAGVTSSMAVTNATRSLCEDGHHCKWRASLSVYQWTPDAAQRQLKRVRRMQGIEQDAEDEGEAEGIV